jgi:hypothetical protein
LTLGTRRNGSNQFGPFNRAFPGRRTQRVLDADGARDHGYTGRHVSPRRKTARKRAGQVVPAAAAAATLAAGAAAYILVGAGHPQAAQLNAAMAKPGTASTLGAGGQRVAASTMINAAVAARASAVHAVAHTAAKARPAASAARSPAVTPARPAAHASATASRPAASRLSCDLNYSLLPMNVTAIVSFLLAHGYSDNAAAGIAGNIYQESKGDPESVGMGGGGLIGWTPLRAGFITGNPAADLQTQLAAILDYNEGWSSYLPALNSAASPASAAYIYVTDFERAGIPAAATREASAANVASACGI